MRAKAHPLSHHPEQPIDQPLGAQPEYVPIAYLAERFSISTMALRKRLKRLRMIAGAPVVRRLFGLVHIRDFDAAVSWVQSRNGWKSTISEMKNGHTAGGE